MKWTKLKVHVDPLAVDAVSNLMLELGVEGIEIEDNFLSEQDKEAMYVDYVDAALVPLEEYRVVAYLDESMSVESLQAAIVKGLEHIREFLEVGSGAILIEAMPDEDYENKWKEFYAPFRVGEHMIITPIWERPETKEGDLVVKIDPGMAFGSGTHETTSLCVEYLQNIGLENADVVDMGCGSGILGLVAGKLGAKTVTAIDIDENAVAIAKENVVSNELDHVMTVSLGSEMSLPSEAIDVVIANILADVIIDLTPEAKRILKKSGYFISSGILNSRVEEVTGVLATNNFDVIEVKEKGEWSAILAKKVA